MDKRLVITYLVINALFAVLLISALFFPWPIIQAILGIPAVLFIPGFSLLLAIFPGNTIPGWWERVAFSVGLSIAVVALIGLGLNETGFSIRPDVVIISLWLFVLITSSIGLGRDKRLSREKRLFYFPAGNRLITWTSVMTSGPAKLLPILILGYVLVFLPHFNYAYPLHVDEWIHLAYSRALQAANSGTVFAVPLYEHVDFATNTISILPGDLEPGFHMFWALFQGITSFSWLTVFRYFPGIIFLLTIFTVYVFARRKGYGLEAALFSALMPTNLTMLGPSFLVPVALGMMFLPLTLLLFFYHRSIASYVVQAICFSFLILMHLASAIIIAIILVPPLVLYARKEYKHCLITVVSIVIPLLALSPVIIKMMPEFARSLTQVIVLPPFLPYLSSSFSLWGYLPVLIFIAGVFLLAKERTLFGYSLILSCLILILYNLVFVILHRGLTIIYHRDMLFLILLMSIVAGYTLKRLRNLPLYDKLTVGIKYHSRLVYRLSPVLLVIIGLIILEVGGLHLKTPYYHMIDAQDYAAFVWMERNVPDKYEKTVLDPWKATAFMALTGRQVYTRIQHAGGEADMRAYEFLSKGSSDTDFLRSNGISIVYSPEKVVNDDLVRLRNDVFILPRIGTQ